MKNPLKYYAITLLLLSTTFSLFGQDTIELTDGTTKQVVITKFNSDAISFYNFGDETKKEYTIPMDLVVLVTRDGQKETAKITSEENRLRKAVYVDLLGPGGLGSLNYDMRFKRGDGSGFGGRIGVGSVVTLLGSSISGIFEVNHALKKNNSYLIVGFGFVVTEKQGLFTSQTKDRGFLSDVAYRYMAPKQGFFFQASLVPVLYSGETYTLPFSVSLGFAF